MTKAKKARRAAELRAHTRKAVSAAFELARLLDREIEQLRAGELHPDALAYDLANELADAGGEVRRVEVRAAAAEGRAVYRQRKVDELVAELRELREAANVRGLSRQERYNAVKDYLLGYRSRRGNLMNIDYWEQVETTFDETYDDIVAQLTGAYERYLKQLVRGLRRDSQAWQTINELIRATMASGFFSDSDKYFEEGDLCGYGLPKRRFPIGYDLAVALFAHFPGWWTDFEPQKLPSPDEAHAQATAILRLWEGDEPNQLLAAQRVLSACREEPKIANRIGQSYINDLMSLRIRLQRKLRPAT